jgi:RES domain-containing protein
MLSGAALENAIRQLSSRPRRGTFFRAIPVEYQRTPLGHPPSMGANRFNLAGGTATLYLGASAHVCVDEVQMDTNPPRATVIFPVEFDLRAVADLHDANVLAALGLTPADVTFNFRSLGPHAQHATQLLGECCATLGCIDGLLYPSAAHASGQALAVFVDSLPVLGSSLVVHKANGRVWQRLP